MNQIFSQISTMYHPRVKELKRRKCLIYKELTNSHPYSFPLFHPPRVKELENRKWLIYKEIYIYFSILSPFHPHPPARPAYPRVYVCVRGGGERVKELLSVRNSLHINVLRRSILSPHAILSPPLSHLKRYFPAQKPSGRVEETAQNIDKLTFTKEDRDET
jgi:hypothetical protein